MNQCQKVACLHLWLSTKQFLAKPFIFVYVRKCFKSVNIFHFSFISPQRKFKIRKSLKPLMTGIKKLFECLWRIDFLNKQQDLQNSSAVYQKFRRQRVWWSRARCFMCLCFSTLALKVRQWDNYVVDTKGAQKCRLSSVLPFYTHTFFSFLINKNLSFFKKDRHLLLVWNVS